MGDPADPPGAAPPEGALPVSEASATRTSHRKTFWLGSLALLACGLALVSWKGYQAYQEYRAIEEAMSIAPFKLPERAAEPQRELPGILADQNEKRAEIGPPAEGIDPRNFDEAMRQGLIPKQALPVLKDLQSTPAVQELQQELEKDPKLKALFQKFQKNPDPAALMQEIKSDPTLLATLSKFMRDPHVQSLMSQVRTKTMGGMGAFGPAQPGPAAVPPDQVRLAAPASQQPAYQGPAAEDEGMINPAVVSGDDSGVRVDKAPPPPPRSLH